MNITYTFGSTIDCTRKIDRVLAALRAAYPMPVPLSVTCVDSDDVTPAAVIEPEDEAVRRSVLTLCKRII